MSLLLEALKKAERAKEEAQRRARGESAPGPNDAAATEPAERKAVLTRDKLPDISPSLEIVSHDLPSAERAPLELTPEPAAAKESARLRPAASAAADAAASRASAKKVFEAKFRESNPRTPFHVTMGALGVLALGTVVYFWYQLRPAPSLANPQPAALASVPATAAPLAPSLGSAGAIPGLPAAAKSTPVAAIAEAPVRAATPPAAETPRLRAEPRREEPRLPTASVARAPAQVHPNVAAGYAAYVTGDFATARNEYQQALREEPGNRDALLGLAALEIRGGRYETAEALYLRVLQADPRDPQAQAALIALRSGRSDALASESRVKSLLAADPGAHALNFTLGNQLASQNRWAEAQQEYFRAYTAEPDNADFAYNLAVSLDHLRQPRQALDYYRRAITLGEKHGAGFDLGAARARAAQLGR
ncbi:MAG: tetratricopeptide repeat protein [Betaproteobacteria bacterium]|nr:MAG: tetratricopeptide repeat protein [Betaproteobacteria bacterium]